MTMLFEDHEGQPHVPFSVSQVLKLLAERDRKLRKVRSLEGKYSREYLEKIVMVLVEDIESIRREVDVLKTRRRSNKPGKLATDTSPAQIQPSADNGSDVDGEGNREILQPFQPGSWYADESTPAPRKRRRFSYAELNSELPIDSATETPSFEGGVSDRSGGLNGNEDVLREGTAQEDDEGVELEHSDPDQEQGQILTNTTDDAKALKVSAPVKEPPFMQEIEKREDILDVWCPPKLRPPISQQVTAQVEGKETTYPAAGKSMERGVGLSQNRGASTPKRRKDKTPIEEDSKRNPAVRGDGFVANAVVRKPSEREALIGSDCRECRENWKFLSAFGKGTSNIKQVCSKHRYQHARPMTPDHWNAVSFTETRTQPP
ncbi:hypothetical protein NDN08_005492 [Rhodosorus marinus]|uniref:DNA endonuclease activator Ctp1 C-terminal domain-containing protein n=1 Tax=Rhodosorus marinus TaxID=101924 RepID=A0AAV8V4U7_9RHOD|nr:hypothetical protein NDN08_005492 [Rhodosorus marinus]